MVNLSQEFRTAFTHHNQTVREGRDLFQHKALVGVGVAQDRVQSGDDRHAQFTQERQDVTTGPAAVDAIFMLQRHHIHVVDIEKIGGAAIGVDVFLGQLEADAGWVIIARFNIVDWQGNTGRAFVFIRNRFTQIGGKGGDAALARQVITDKGNPLDDRKVNSVSYQTAPSPNNPSYLVWLITGK